MTWQQTVAIAFELAESKGATFDGIDEGGQFMSELSMYWQQEKDRLKQLTRDQARRDLNQVIEA